MTKREYAEYLKTDHWRAIRKHALIFALHRCSICGAHWPLEVHHNNYERIGEEFDSDVVVLCADCHQLFHDKLPAAALGESIPVFISDFFNEPCSKWVGRVSPVQLTDGVLHVNVTDSIIMYMLVLSKKDVMDELNIELELAGDPIVTDIVVRVKTKEMQHAENNSG